MRTPLTALTAAALTGALVLGSSPAAGQQAPGTPVFTAITNLVVLYASVLDKSKHPVTGLQKEHFKVFENNVEQPIKEFKREDVPVSVGILVDNSGSMKEKRAKVNAAALVFVKASNPQDEVFIVNFSDEAFLDRDFTNDIEELKEGLEKIDSRGATAFYDAIITGLDHLHDRGAKARRVLLVISDGVDNASRYTLEQAVKAAQEAETVIYLVALFTDEKGREAKRARRAMEAIADSSGGAAYFPNSLNEVEALAARIAHDIRNQYVLSYTPVQPGEDGQFRSVKVTAAAKGFDKLAVRTRTGYYVGSRKSPASSAAGVPGRAGKQK